MEMYKKQLSLDYVYQQQKVYYQSNKFTSLSFKDMVASIRALNETMKKTNDSDLEFLDDNSTEDPLVKLSFDIMKDVYTTKKEEAEKLRDAASIRQQNVKIMELIERRKNMDLESKSLEELEALLINQ